MAIEHNGYKDCNLEKYKCFFCDNEFIVGTEMLNGKKPSCPYCKYGQTEKIVRIAKVFYHTKNGLICQAIFFCIGIKKEKLKKHIDRNISVHTLYKFHFSS